MIQINNKKRNISKLDMAPLIDVVFLLLIFFMLTFAVQGEGMNIDLPTGSAQGKPSPEKNLIVKLAEDGTVYLQQDAVSVHELPKKFEGLLKNKKNKTVEIHAHSKVRYDLFTQVLDYARIAGGENFSIVR